ncbi:MAG: hypothetical protein VW450_01815 [Chloroflexota bacterium]
MLQGSLDVELRDSQQVAVGAGASLALPGWNRHIVLAPRAARSSW